MIQINTGRELGASLAFLPGGPSLPHPNIPAVETPPHGKTPGVSSLTNLRKGEYLMRGQVVVSGLLALSFVSSAQAQMSLDVSKITCDQFVHGKIGPTRTVAAWLSGFYNGKQNKQIIDTSAFEANLSKLEQFCYQEKNFNVPVLQAIESAGLGR